LKPSSQALHILRDAAASDAFHDSVERYPQPKCHPETRTQILDDLYHWSSEDRPPDAPSSILWLHGPAGSGKSAIAQSLCQKLAMEGRLGASFFFKRRHPSRGNVNKLFATIAYQLALGLPQLKHAISQIVEDDLSVLNRSISVQLQKLIIEPCQQTTLPLPIIIIIDGLDECEDQQIQQEILRLIGDAEGKQLPLRFFVASRPEPHIGEVLRDPCLEGILAPWTLTNRLKMSANISRTNSRGFIGSTMKPWPTYLAPGHPPKWSTSSWRNHLDISSTHPQSSNSLMIKISVQQIGST
jgi:hypothetical protein